MKKTSLTKENFLLFAAKQYNNPSCLDTKEFLDDIRRFRYVKRLLKKYGQTGELAERLILNHIILLHNVFGSGIVPMLFFEIDKKYWPQLKTFLIYLNYLPENYVVQDSIIETDIPLDNTIVDKLRII